jgi:hypothetical protein
MFLRYWEFGVVAGSSEGWAAQIARRKHKMREDCPVGGMGGFPQATGVGTPVANNCPHQIPDR